MKVKYSVGNRKVGIGKDTLIINITSAHDCVSLKKGLCQVPPGTCYAWRDENLYKGCLPSRRLQERIWDSLSADEFAEQLKEIIARESKLPKARPVPIKYIRWQESGDFRSQADLDKLSRICELLKGTGVHCYTYTARRDLSLNRHSSNLTINGSGFKVDNEFRVVTELQPGARCRGIKGGGCYGCSLCKETRGTVIQELLRGGGKQKTKNDILEGDEHGGIEAAPDTFVATSGNARYSVAPKKTKKASRSKTSAGIGTML